MLENNPENSNNKDVVQSDLSSKNAHSTTVNSQMESLSEHMSVAEKMQLVRDIWLAGLGAYSNSLSGQRVLGEKSSIFFEKLLTRGKQVEYDYELSTHKQHISLHGLDKLSVPPKRVQQDQVKIFQLQAKVEALSAILKQAQNN